MDEVEGARAFHASGDAYDAFMGRYSAPLAVQFAEAAMVRPGNTALDVGCGPGALIGALIELLGAGAVRGCDPSASFVAECARRHPGVDVRLGRAEAIPFDDASFDRGLAQLVLHFVSDPVRAATELRRVVRPAGTVAACVWDFADGMEMLRRFWDAALAVVPDAPDEARTLRFGRAGEIAELFGEAGLVDVLESTLRVESMYVDFDDLWSGFLAGIGPAGTFCVSLADQQRDEVRARLYSALGSPAGPFTLGAVARCAVGSVPAVR